MHITSEKTDRDEERSRRDTRLESLNMVVIVGALLRASAIAASSACVALSAAKLAALMVVPSVARMTVAT